MVEKLKIGAKTTKAEIANYARELEKELKSSKAAQPITAIAERTKASQTAVVEYVSKLSPGQIVDKIAELKKQTVETFENTEKQSLAQFNEFVKFTDAKNILLTELEELHGIKTSAETLEALSLTIETANAAFEDESTRRLQELEDHIFTTQAAFEASMAEKKASWAKEQTLHEIAVKEWNAELQKTRQREQDNYSYTTGQSRKLEMDAFNAQKATHIAELEAKSNELISSLEAREKAVVERETKMAGLEAQVAGFPDQLKTEIAKRVAIETSSLKKDHENQFALADMAAKGAAKLAEQEINSLKAKVVELSQTNELLATRAAEAVEKVQDIATKAIDGASQAKVIQNTYKDENSKSSK